MTDKQMDDIMNAIGGKLGEILDGVADVKCIKGDKMNNIISTYMDYPIIKLEVARAGSDVRVNMCNIDDVIKVLPDAIGTLLGLIPEEYRNDVLFKAIHVEMTDTGALQDKLNEDD